MIFKGLPIAAALVALITALTLTAPALAQGKSPFGGFKHDRKAQIEVAADSLKVVQEESLAVFEGAVEAQQGTLKLTTDKLAVTYGAIEADGDTGKIRHMRADGNVFLVNGDETAKGEWAEYDVAVGTIRIGGNVLVTQGGNAISAQIMKIDLNTGRAEAVGGSGRVTSTFAPSDSN